MWTSPLEIGTATESIKVEANPIAVKSDTGEVSDVITSQEVTQIATNGRSIYSLALLVPGTSNNMPGFQAPTAAGANANISFNGQRQNHNLWLADGAEQSDRGGAGGSDHRSVPRRPGRVPSSHLQLQRGVWALLGWHDEHGVQVGDARTSMLRRGSSSATTSSMRTISSAINPRLPTPTPAAATASEHVRLQRGRTGHFRQTVQQGPQQDLLLLQPWNGER